MRWLERWRRTTSRASQQDGARVAFECNLCGTHNQLPMEALDREGGLCVRCGSTVRWRAIVHLVCASLLDQETVIPRARPRKDLRGLGLSDDSCVDKALGAMFDYTNTYYHTGPQLDIANVPESLYGTCDFLTASDVFEHVVPPVAVAFSNARRLLKPSGVFVFTVPFSLEAETIEHFPELDDYRLQEVEGRWILRNRTRDGREQRYDNLVFHGGPGTTLEMRLFSRAALERHFADAGFTRVHFASEPCPRFGIVWREPWSIPIVARP